MTLGHVEAVYRLDVELTSTEVAVLAALAAMADEAQGRCWYRQQHLAKRLRLHPDTIKTTLQGLARKQLIGKAVKHNDTTGAAVATQIELRFEPVALGGVQGPRGPGVVAPPSPGVLDPGLKTKVSEEKEDPHSPQGGVAVVVSQADVEAVWAITPSASRRRSTSKEEVRKALRAAYRRGRGLAEILAGLKAYFESPETNRERARFMKGVHRVIVNDRWQAFVSAGTVTPISDDPWPARVRRWGWSKSWDFAWGPPPDAPGCQAPAALIATVCPSASGPSSPPSGTSSRSASIPASA